MLSRSTVTQPVKVIDARAPEQHAPRAAAGAGVRGRRIHFVDLLRLLASFQMIHGHTLDALMAEEQWCRSKWGEGDAVCAE